MGRIEDTISQNELEFSCLLSYSHSYENIAYFLLIYYIIII